MVARKYNWYGNKRYTKPMYSYNMEHIDRYDDIFTTTEDNKNIICPEKCLRILQLFIKYNTKIC